MIKTHLRKTGIFVLIVNLIFAGLPHAAFAGLAGTGAALEMQAHPDRMARIDAFLARGEVQEQLVNMGVDPAQAQARVARLTESELQLLEQRIDELPAGGSILALIGAVFVILLILELVGVINIFNKM